MSSVDVVSITTRAVAEGSRQLNRLVGDFEMLASAMTEGDAGAVYDHHAAIATIIVSAA